MDQICSHWNQWQNSRDPHWKQVLASTEHLWKFQLSGQNVLNISEVSCSVALKGHLPMTHTQSTNPGCLPRAPALRAHIILILLSAVAWSHCCFLNPFSFPSWFPTSYITYFPVVLTAHYNNLNFTTMLNQEVSSSSLFFPHLFLFSKWYNPSQIRKRSIYLAFTPSFISLNKTRLKTNPQSTSHYYFSPDWYTVCPSASMDSVQSCAPPASSTLLVQAGLWSWPVIKRSWIISTAFPLMPSLIK